MCKNIQTIGSVLKEECIQVLDFSIIKNTLVFEITDPFPGYHSEIIEKGKPKTVFFALKQSMLREDSARLNKELKLELDFPFHITHSKLIFNHQNFDAIRVYDVDSYDNIHKLQLALAKHFLPFMKSNSKGGEAIIRTFKQFNLSKSSDGIYISNKNPNFSYIVVPKQESWDDFKEITLKIKNSWDLVNFDAAQGILYIDNDIQDVVRIYSESAKEKDLLEIREKYLDKIK